MTPNGTNLPHLRSVIPGPQSQQWIDRLARHECPAVTARRARRASSLGVAQDDPIVWKSAIGSNVVDVDGNCFVDLTAGFGVAGAGHRNEKVVQALQHQSTQLLHAMGDAFPDPQRIKLMEQLAELTELDQCLLGCSGSDSIEAAIKTARLATGRHEVLAFHNGYHGLAFGSLAATDYKADSFRAPFVNQLGAHVQHAEYGGNIPDLSTIGAVIVEPVQGRGGIVEPPSGWLATLIDKAHAAGALVIFDEIYTGFGRTGDRFATFHESLNGRRPDLICIGKAMAGGFPISACVGSAEVMAAWGASKGEALHTQTFLGNPLGSAMALAAIAELEDLRPAVGEKSHFLRQQLENNSLHVRGRGLMLGIELDDALSASRKLLKKGYIVLPAGPNCEVLAVTPPLCITEKQLKDFVQQLLSVID